MTSANDEKRPLLAGNNTTTKNGSPNDVTDSMYLDKNTKRDLKHWDFIFIAVLCLDIICQGMGYALIASFYPITARTKGLTTTDVGIVIAALPVATIVFGIAFSYLLPKMGTRYMLLASMVIGVISLLPFGFVMHAPSGWPFYTASVACRIGQGIAFVASQVAAFSIVAGDYNDRMATMMGMLEMALGVGLSLGPAAGGLFYDLYGFMVPFIFLCCLNGVLFIVSIFIIHPTYSYTDVRIKISEGDDTKTSSPVLNVRTIFKMPEIFLPLAVCTSIYMNWTFFDVSLAPFMSQFFGFSSSAIGLVFLVLAGLYAVLAPIVGLIVERKGHGGLVLALGCFIVAPAFLFIGPVPFLNIGHLLWVTLLALVIIYCACSLMYVPGMGLCFDMATARGVEDNERTRGFISSAFVLAGNIGNLLGPFLGGVLIDACGFEWTGLFYGLTTLVIGILSAGYLLYRRKRSLGRDEEKNLLSN